MTASEATIENAAVGESRRPFVVWPDNAWVWLGVIYALGMLVPYVPVSSPLAGLIGAVFFMVLGVWATVMFAARAAAIKFSAAQQAGLMLGFLALWCVLQFVTKPLLQGMMAAHGKSVPQGLTWLGMTNFTLRGMALLCATVFGGAWVARLITSPNMLAPICASIALIDFWGVLLGGPVSQMLEKAPTVSQAAMTSMPKVGGATKAAQQFNIPELQIGAGDFLFLGLLFAALHYNQMNWRGSAKLIIPFISLTLAGTLVFDHLPGLVPIGLGIALPNLRYFKFTREENFAMLWAGLLVIVLSIGAYFGVQKMLPEKKPVSTTDKRE